MNLFGWVFRGAGVDSSAKSDFLGVASGFKFGKTHFPWGTHLNELLQDSVSSRQPLNPRWISCGAGSYFGLDMAEVEAREGFNNGPVVQVSYGIALPKHASHIEFIENSHRNLAKTWGKPSYGDRYLIDLQLALEGFVIGNAEWRRGAVRVGLSWFGSPRITTQGMTSGILYIDWDDEIAIARPYVESWLKHREELERLPKIGFEILGRLKVFEQSARTWRSYHFDAPNPATDVKLQIAQRAMYAPKMVFTPRSLLKALVWKADDFALWRSQNDRCWGLSNRFDTVCFQEGEAVKVVWDRIMPAKGSGGHFISCAGLLAQLPYGEVATFEKIQNFCDLLAGIKGVVCKINDGSDC